MTEARIFIGLGGNLDNPSARIGDALERLHGHGQVAVVQCSRHYRSPPWGRSDQPAFVNAVAELSSGLAPGPLLAELAAIEDRHGRQRSMRWGPRTLDLDMLVYGDLVRRSEDLVLPHPRLSQRAFVLAPWAEIAPDFGVVGLGPVRDLLAACPDVGEVTPIEQDEPCMKLTATELR